ncbi:Na(+)/H(+) antiporter subunit B [Dasania sp. GY-MA-18]|uniref:Na(+)/H(+) antiporter subunit B n=1 Tax=Dasania phycosphaerae TaxID=2950436 RepID=A0A9J6RNM1_9GAMM|nr:MULTISPECIES: Na(+)/H(+) antiporter subunit B [Dasania]MCR8923892.1 Na(+)/H(+) antiporter subunit B [Dasania sp. GY-MA-18]MCZ0866326.1 Na(+)/H(+) antiporter subunit B [Dasania phycosphaerae]MCZ0870050.1 Na(+)/H(+) antiporter subunit B [Dasania phycosphaerae]
MELFVNVILLSFLLAIALAIVRMKDLFAVIMLAGIYGLLSASFFVVVDAVDVAITEAAVGAGVFTLLMLVATVMAGRYEQGARHKPLLALAVVFITGSLLIYGSLDMPAFGYGPAPDHQHVDSHYINESMSEVGVPNIVTAVLASYRGFDTLGELLVIFTAGVAVMALLSTLYDSHSNLGTGPENKWLYEQQMPIRLVVKILIPFIMLFAFYIQFHGDYGPGGGFQAGLILASAIILYAMLFGIRTAKQVISPRFYQCLSAFGILLYGGVGVVALLNGEHFLDYSVLFTDPLAGQHVGIVLVELGIGCTVFSTMILIFLNFYERKNNQLDGCQ